MTFITDVILTVDDAILCIKQPYSNRQIFLEKSRKRPGKVPKMSWKCPGNVLEFDWENSVGTLYMVKDSFPLWVRETENRPTVTMHVVRGD